MRPNTWAKCHDSELLPYYTIYLSSGYPPSKHYPTYNTCNQWGKGPDSTDLHLFSDVQTLWIRQVENPLELSVCIRYYFILTDISSLFAGGGVWRNPGTFPWVFISWIVGWIALRWTTVQVSQRKDIQKKSRKYSWRYSSRKVKGAAESFMNFLLKV